MQEIADAFILRRERAFAHARRVGFHRADDFADAIWRHARAGASAAGRCVTAGHVGIRAEINVEESALRALKEHLLLGLHLLGEIDDGVCEKRRDNFCRFEVFLARRFDVEWGGFHRFQNDVCFVQTRLQFLRKTHGLEQLARPHPDARNLVRVSRPDAAPGRADLAFSLRRFLRLIERAMEWQREMRAVGDHQILRRHDDALLAQADDFARQRHSINDHTVADDAHDALAQNAARDQVQHVFHAIHDDRVPCVIPALRAHDDVGALREEIYYFAFAFIAPLSADEDRICHISKLRWLFAVKCPPPEAVGRGRVVGDLAAASTLCREKALWQNLLFPQRSEISRLYHDEHLPEINDRLGNDILSARRHFPCISMGLSVGL